jgi:Flp pilus assembly protein TadG
MRSSWIQDERGSVMVMTLVVAPLLLVALSGVLQLGALRVAAARIRAAADLATLVAVNDQDDAELARSGTLRLSSDAVDVAREYFARELELSFPLLDRPADEIAAAADVAAYPSAPAYDTRSGARYDRPTVRIAADVPVRTPVFGALVLRPVTMLHVVAVSSPR